MGKVAVDRPSNYGEIVTLEICEEIVKLEGGQPCNEEGEILREKYLYDWQKVAHHDEVGKVYAVLHHVVLALLITRSHGRKSSDRERRVLNSYELRSLLSRLALSNAAMKYKDDTLNPRVLSSIIDDSSLDKVQLRKLETLVSSEGKDQLLDPQSKSVSTNLEIDVFTFYKSDHVSARGDRFNPPRVLGLDTCIRVLKIWDEPSRNNEPSYSNDRMEVEVEKTEMNGKVYLMIFEASSGRDQILKKMAQLERDLEYAYIHVNQSETDSNISKKVAFAGLSIMGESDLGIEFDILQMEFLISRFHHIFPRLFQMLEAGALIYAGHQNSLNFDVRKIARRLGELSEKIENLQKGEEMHKFEARILDGIEDRMNRFENRMVDGIEDRMNRLENRMDSFQTSLQDLISKTMESYLGKLDISQ